MSRRLTTEEFIERARAVHGDRYDYSQVRYVGTNTKVTIVCRNHGSFQVTPSRHISNGAGCIHCAGSGPHTTKKFIEKANAVHGDRYDYSQVRYVNRSTKVAIVCRKHGSFEITPINHLFRKSGCPDCLGLNRLTTEEFIENAKAAHGDRYDYSEVEYVNNKTNVTIICPDHGPFSCTPNNHVSHYAGCAKCKGANPLSAETFVERSRAVHGDRYDYSQVRYKNSYAKVIIVCRNHGSFEQNPTNHVSSRAGCPECSGRRLTTEKFIEKAEAVHGDRYDYSRVAYVNSRTHVTIICPDHGPFSLTPPNHVGGKVGCPECKGVKRHSNESFIEKANTIHSDRYDYSQVEYVNSRTDVTIICPDHGPFSQTPHDHLGKTGCHECGGTKPLTAELFIEKAKAIHGDRYDYSQVEYVNNRTRITIICPNHGPFQQTGSHHLSARGCPGCAETGFNPSEPGLLYYIAVTTDEIDTLYKIGITNTSVERRFPGPDLARIRVVKTWHFAVGRDAAEREAEILCEFAGDRYYGPDILVGAGNTELFTRDVLVLDKQDGEHGQSAEPAIRQI